jgi:hypothetical protein
MRIGFFALSATLCCSTGASVPAREPAAPESSAAREPSVPAQPSAPAAPAPAPASSSETCGPFECRWFDTGADALAYVLAVVPSRSASARPTLWRAPSG